MKRFAIISALMPMFLLSIVTEGQNSSTRTLLPDKIVNELIGEASGEKAMKHIIEMAAYIHDRPSSEYTGDFSETEYMLGKMKEYKLEGAAVDKYPGGKTWDGVKATLWEISPGRQKIADYSDLPAILASGSTSADVTADLIWVGEGNPSDIDPLDLKDKIAVTSGNISMVHNLAVAKGALGVISYNSPRPLEVSSAIPISGIGGRQATTNTKFGFFLPPREGILLRDRLMQGEKIKVHAVVESQNLDYDLEVPTCIIKGTNPTAGEVIFSAHLYEGFVKMGANDDISGCAAILEIARMLNSMIDDGRLQRPTRSIRFIWAPEFSGTGPWVNAHQDIVKMALCNINLDMVGLRLKESNSFLCMHRTTYANAHYINDVMENYYNFVGMGNRSNLAISGREGFSKPIVAMTGTDDPFYYSIDDHYGASDHEVFNDWGVQVPGIMMITWPDLYYHTSQDVADKCDATQLKRVCFIGAASAYTIASADEDMALKIAAEITGNSASRLGKQLQRAIFELDGSNKENFESIYRRTKGYIEAAVLNEKNTVQSVTELAGSNSTWNNKYSASIDGTGKSLLSGFDAYAGFKGNSLGITSLAFKLSDLEIKAKSIIPVPTQLITSNGYRGYSEIINKLDASLRQKYPVSSRSTDTQELSRLCNGKNSILDIKKMLDAQMKTGEASLQDVINYTYILKEAGLVIF